MLIIPGFLISLLTFPGVIVHEFAHKTFCHRYDVPVYEVCYFRLGNPAGFVIHEEPRRYRQSFMISVAPFLVNTALALAAFVAIAVLWGAPSGDLDTDRMGWGALVLLWLGISVGMHAFPSTGDAKGIWSRTRRLWRTSPLVLLGVPFVLLIYVANLLRFLWFDAIYAIGLLLLALLSVGLLTG